MIYYKLPKVNKVGAILLLNIIQFNSLPNNKFLDLPKLKAYADDKINMTEKLKFFRARVENMVGKGENAGYQDFLYTGSIESCDCVVKG